MKLMSLMMSAALALAGRSALAAATTYTWQPTTGGDMAVEGNWSPNKGLILLLK